jgi:hypothetical protein
MYMFGTDTNFFSPWLVGSEDEEHTDMEGPQILLEVEKEVQVAPLKLYQKGPAGVWGGAAVLSLSCR